ncbi:hypothetical protein [Mycoplasmopsis edwardii]|uniref:Uncharacterized protein n=1 Tax=Mycoplasmopsis edwardii TaxID=53558 RepID=A0ACD4PJ57_9BACT|nr:hypothetical protein [Mycoplasmopsis edwardii]WBP84128.1 hypothetical protein Me_995_000079 [Mycoplasmopsis edwardii]
MSYFKQVEQKLKKSSGVRILLLDSQNEKVKQAVRSIGILSNIKFFKLEDLIDIKNIKEEENNLARFIELMNGTFNYESTKKLFATNKTLFHSLVLLKEKRIDGIIGGLTSSFETFVDSLKSSLSYLNEDKIISFVSFAQNEEKHFFMSYTNEAKKNEVNLLSQVALNLNEYKKEISDLGDLVLLNKDLNQSKLLEVIKNIDPSIKVQNQVRLSEALDTNQNWLIFANKNTYDVSYDIISLISKYETSGQIFLGVKENIAHISENLSVEDIKNTIYLVAQRAQGRKHE